MVALFNYDRVGPKMEKQNIFQLIHMIEQMNNANIVRFTQQFPYPIGISPILALAELKKHGVRKQVELAESLGYTKGAMTNIANKLVQLELAERVYDVADRRIIQMKITNKGLEALKIAQTVGEELYTELFAVFTEDELAQFLSLHYKLMQRA